ncbi:MAG TPA: cytochrome b/b6 domain-containing protein [Acidimicrobiia bacterium]|nr:cytochrome b/b6 domain-containing protein [Acidimicrobiia bacterium]
MRLRPDERGYGIVFKLLHWTMFLALVAQFVVGYAMDRAEFLLEGLVDRWLAGEEEALLPVHVALGSVILVLAVIRVLWRKWVGLPLWADGLSPTERRLAHAVERILYWLMFLIPLTGLALVLVSGEDWDLRRGEWQAPRDWVDDDLLLAGHIATHVAFFVAFAVHVGLVLKHQFIDRDGLLRRML